MKKILFILLIAATSAATFSCSEEEAIPDDRLTNLHLIAERQLSGTDLKINIYSETKTLITGYNRFFFQLVAENGQTYSDAEIAISPLMDMGEMMHAAPVESPVFNPDENLFEGAVVFVMPSTAGSWNLTLSVTDHQGQQSVDVDVPVVVMLPEEPRLISFIHNENKYFISLIEPSVPQVGVNDFEIAVHKKTSMMDWPVVDDFAFRIEPKMPTMGHGSPNNVNPVSAGNGHYAGKVNFTMDGYWKVNIDASVDGVEVPEDLFFDITFSAKSSL